MTAKLKTEGFVCSENRVAALMKKAGIFGCAKPKFKLMRDDNSYEKLPPVARLFETGNPESMPQGSNQVWAGDITQMMTSEGWLYLAVVLDIFNRKVVGYSMSDHPDTEIVWEAMKLSICNQTKALSSDNPKLIAHSDQGRPYISSFYRDKLQMLGITQSMSRRGNCYDNAYVESFFHTLKVELIHRNQYQTKAQMQLEIKDYIENWYNTQRLHSSLGFKSPMNYEQEATAA